MKVLNWWEVKQPGYYWAISEENASNFAGSEVIQVNSAGRFSHFGIEDEFQFSEEEHLDYKFVKIEAPVIPAPPAYQEGFLNHGRNNGDSKFPRKVEGYWRSRETLIEHVGPGRHTANFMDKQNADLPWPYIWQIWQFPKQAFINRLADIEDLAEKHLYRGISMCRITGVSRGNAEYEYKGWKWPAGFIEYVRLGVPPSRAFYAFIMGETQAECLWLPTYNREEDE
jgi:hypothetical protein